MHVVVSCKTILNEVKCFTRTQKVLLGSRVEVEVREAVGVTDAWKPIPTCTEDHSNPPKWGRFALPRSDVRGSMLSRGGHRDRCLVDAGSSWKLPFSRFGNVGLLLCISFGSI